MVIRQTNFLGQMRVDVPLLRAMESSVAADFDLAVGTIFGGKQPLVVRGFALTNITAGSPANQIQCAVANSVFVNFNSTESGSMYSVPANRANEVMSSTNAKVTGAFTSSATNFIGIDLRRLADDTTSDTLQFLNGTTLLETSKTVPLARTLDYRFVISTSDFAAQPNLVPLAKVVTDASNNIVSVDDARQLAFRLGDGGDFPDRQGFYSWPGTRSENLTGDVFSGGDKAILSQKDWADAAMTRMWELGGGEYWYSATADRNVNLVWTGTTFTNGENYEWDGTHLHWRDLRFIFDNSTGYFNDVQNQLTNSVGLTNLADGECIYVDLDRTQNFTNPSGLLAAKAVLTTLGPGSIPGSRNIIAWRVGSSVFTRGWRYPVGTTFQPATTTSLGMVRLNQTPGSPLTPYVVSIMADGQISVTATANNSAAAYFTGFGNGQGLRANGGTGNGDGVWGTGGDTGGTGLFGLGGLNNGNGVQGTANGSGKGVAGNSTSGTAVHGTSTTGAAVQGTSTSGAAVTGASTSGPGLQSTQGDAEIPAANKYKYATARSASLHIPASAFQANFWGNDISADPQSRFGGNGTAARRAGAWIVSSKIPGQNARLALKSPMNLPNGATLTSIQVMYGSDDGGTANNNTFGLIRAQLWKRTISGSTITTTRANTTSGSININGTGGVTQAESAALPLSGTVDNSTETYELNVDVAADYNWVNPSVQPLTGTAGGGNACSTLKDGRVLITGGKSGSTAVASAWIYNPMTSQLVAVTAMNNARSDHKQCSLNDGTVIVFGGSTGNGTTRVQTCEVYDPDANTWTNTTGSLTNAIGFSWIMHPRGDVVYVLGGTTAGQERVLSFVNSGSAGALTSSAADRVGATLAWYTTAVGGTDGADTLRLAALGGGASFASRTTTWESYNAFTDAWTTGTGALATAINSAVAVTTENGYVFIAGGGAAAAAQVMRRSGGVDATANFTSLTAPATNLSAGKAFMLPDGRILTIPAAGASGTQIFKQVGTNGTWEVVSGAADNVTTAADQHTNGGGDATMLVNGEVITVPGGADIYHVTPGSHIVHKAARLPSLTFFGLRVNYTYTEVNVER